MFPCLPTRARFLDCDSYHRELQPNAGSANKAGKSIGLLSQLEKDVVDDAALKNAFVEYADPRWAVYGKLCYIERQLRARVDSI